MAYMADGEAVTEQAIREAFEGGKARLVNSYGIGKTLSTLSLQDDDFDSRGQTVMMQEARWTSTPESLQECLQVAYIPDGYL